jgi:hypothetical protein
MSPVLASAIVGQCQGLPFNARGIAAHGTQRRRAADQKEPQPTRLPEPGCRRWTGSPWVSCGERRRGAAPVGGEGNAAVQEPAVPHGASRPRRGRIQSREGRAPLLAGDKSSLTEGGGRPTACVAKRMHIAESALENRQVQASRVAPISAGSARQHRRARRPWQKPRSATARATADLGSDAF